MKFPSSYNLSQISARSKANAAIETMRQSWDNFKRWVDQKEDEGERAWDTSKTKLEQEWDSFEEGVETALKEHGGRDIDIQGME